VHHHPRKTETATILCVCQVHKTPIRYLHAPDIFQYSRSSFFRPDPLELPLLPPIRQCVKGETGVSSGPGEPLLIWTDIAAHKVANPACACMYVCQLLMYWITPILRLTRFIKSPARQDGLQGGVHSAPQSWSAEKLHRDHINT
jgi:hypothetical protein